MTGQGAIARTLESAADRRIDIDDVTCGESQCDTARGAWPMVEKSTTRVDAAAGDEAVRLQRCLTYDLRIGQAQKYDVRESPTALAEAAGMAPCAVSAATAVALTS
jgi:hypothetical protein